MIKKILPAIGIILFAYLIYKTGPGNLYNNFKQANFYYIAIAIFATAAYMVLQTFKWNMIMKRQLININFKELFKMHIKSNFYAIITPGRIGGFIKAAYLKERLGANFGKAISSILIDRVLDTISLFVLAFIGGLFLAHKFLDISYAIFFGFLFVMAMIYVLFNKRITRRLLVIFYDRFLPERYKESVRESFHSFYENLPRKRQLILPLIVNLITWVATYTIGYIIALSLGIRISYLILITMYSMSTVVGLIPITISGIGTREAMLVGLLGLFGIAADKIVAMSLITFSIVCILPAIAGLFLVVKDGNIHKAW